MEQNQAWLNFSEVLNGAELASVFNQYDLLQSQFNQQQQLSNQNPQLESQPSCQFSQNQQPIQENIHHTYQQETKSEYNENYFRNNQQLQFQIYFANEQFWIYPHLNNQQMQNHQQLQKQQLGQKYVTQVQQNYQTTNQHGQQQISNIGVQKNCPQIAKKRQSVPKPRSRKQNESTICLKCLRSFATRSYYMQHARVCHTNFQHRCAECGKKFEKKYQLDVHMKRHINTNKLLKCNECTKQYNYVTDLRRHQLRHSGLSPYVCDVCNKAFTRKDHMTKHIKTHSK